MATILRGLPNNYYCTFLRMKQVQNISIFCEWKHNIYGDSVQRNWESKLLREVLLTRVKHLFNPDNIKHQAKHAFIGFLFYIRSTSWYRFWIPSIVDLVLVVPRLKVYKQTLEQMCHINKEL